jgi:hypothetical protein
VVKHAKQIIKRVAPAVFFTLKRKCRQRQFRTGHGGAEYRAKEAIVSQYGKQVLGGPFSGMRYGDDVACSAYLAKLVGSYEHELHELLHEATRRDYRTIVDVGCAEGYYAVGFALRIPAAQVYAFDTDDEARWYCRGLARLNGVADRVSVRGFCGPNELETLCGPRTLIICDCEGYEDELLDPTRAPGLRNVDMIVELHEFVKPGLTANILARFAETHSVRLVDTTERRPETYPILMVVQPVDRAWAVREGRPAPMQWAYMVSKTNSH